MAGRKQDFESLFPDDEVSHPLQPLQRQKANGMKLKIVERHIEKLEITQEGESVFFWQDAAASNLLAFLYLLSDKADLALKQLNRTIEQAPNNLNAIVGMIKVLEQMNNASEAEEKQHQCDKLKDDEEEMEKQKAICQGEIAYACSFIGPEFYMQAAARYEALLQEKVKIWTTKEETNGHIIRWKYYLAYTYNRMLNKGQKDMVEERLGTDEKSAMFDKISKLYDAVIGSDDIFHKGKAMIDLVDTHHKCETFGNYEKIRFPYEYSPDEFVRHALETAPSDPHVLERCGMYCRQRAANKGDFEEALEIFDQLLEIHPTRHVAWHHEGLAYRAVWHIVGKYDEAKLYDKNTSGDSKKQAAKQKHHPQSTRKAPQSANLKNPGFYDKLRTSNPPARKNESQRYLKQAKECFQKAKELTKGTCSPYTVDLARCLISMGMFEEAEKEFVEADKLAGTMHNVEAANLYEQWALLRHYLAGQQHRKLTGEEMTYRTYVSPVDSVRGARSREIARDFLQAARFVTREVAA